MKKLFQQHLDQVQQYFQQALSRCHLDGVWIHAGIEHNHFLDDQVQPFKINPYFKYFVPLTNAVESWLFVDGINKPKLYYYTPQDYWHCFESKPELFWCDCFEWIIITELSEIKNQIKDVEHFAYIGEDISLATELGFTAINQRKLLNYIDYHRAIKTEYEIACIRQAQESALVGHYAAKQAFLEGKSEFEINLAYLYATQQTDYEVPYQSIVAINQHAAILHYNRLQREPPKQSLSFLFDAGTQVNGYASDLTRTYAFDSASEFAELIQKMEKYKREIIAEMQVGYNYLSYHTQMQQNIAELLYESGLVKLSVDQIFDQGISRSFFPHGLGHCLGLQVHDVGGFLQNERGTHKAPPTIYPSLRCTRDLVPNMVLTIEPGFYFIDMLLEPWRNSALSAKFNWQQIEQFKQYGGIRTEDNIVMRETGAENLTEQAALAIDQLPNQ
ncbi:Xaa-Pro dipeptidase [Mergibacter septicus]|uniref:Xaa-Pro dipeptidase n=1 Tax=Mergibacter septicus TaxID=221402 RepID=A0A8E3MGX2_9PAST|nr:Xaa-Pro dipeptidase [Mergibacter septicus]AWX16042.1 Xaa-Pro dipeptidase [Mergibacter septicus]QDJ15295.1 Xaa-Pro dipeptidase [Mergibacter septicus]UTU48836.1 Xaa-Pro dipeptidase [Mergibacter septicus]WMR95534.1 Xaa-Pro dipeptidase [Mergibacter septicus]